MNHCRNGVQALHHPISSFDEGGQTRSDVLPLFHLKMRVMPRSTSFYRVYWTIVRRPGEGPEMDAMILMRRTSQVALARLLTFPFPLLSCVSHVAQKMPPTFVSRRNHASMRKYSQYKVFTRGTRAYNYTHVCWYRAMCVCVWEREVFWVMCNNRGNWCGTGS